MSRDPSHRSADSGILSGTDKTQNRSHHFVQRHRCLNLVIGHEAQQGLNGLDVIKDILLAARDEQDVRVLGGQQRLCPSGEPASRAQA